MQGQLRAHHGEARRPTTMKRSVGVVGWGGGYQNVKGDVLAIGYLTLDDYLPSHYRLFNLQATASANSLPPESQSLTKVKLNMVFIP